MTVSTTAARAFLDAEGVHGISANRFAAVAREHSMSLRETLNFLALLLSGGQGNGPSPVSTAARDRIDTTRAIGKPTPDMLQEYDNASAS